MTDLIEALAGRGLLSEADARQGAKVAVETGRRAAATLIRLGLLDEQDLARALAELHDLPLLWASDLEAMPRIEGFNTRFLIARSVLPLQGEDGIVLAMSDPSDEEAVAAIAFGLGGPVARRAVAAFSDIEDQVRALESGAGDFHPDDLDIDIHRLNESESEAPVIRLVQRLLADAVQRRASDVHIEPMAKHLAVRYRIDGRLVEMEKLPSALAHPVASRIKVLAGLDIAEARKPQDGRLKLTARGRDVDVRVATSPIAHGEGLVLRLLGRTEVPLDIAQIGLPSQVREGLERALARPHGIVLLTGPTGSGKTTTLYSALSRLRRPDVKILTVEDPVEVLLDGVNQVQVKPEIDLDYAATLRAFLRQDPDILMIGEIRDGETADIAMRAALTGHLVLSTLHTNSAAGAFTRLSDIGVQPFLTASSVIATLAQRLIRQLCHCAEPRPVSPEERHLFERAGVPAPDSVREAAGCPDCAQTGFRGRLLIAEIFEVDSQAQQAIRAGDAAALETMLPPARTLLGHGLAVVAEGRTSLGEVQRAVQFA